MSTLRCTVGAWSVATLCTVACGGGGGDGDTASLIDQRLALEEEQSMLECACEPEACGYEGPSATQVQCIKAVFARYADVLGPELQCDVRRTRAQNECYASRACDDTESWEACYDAGGDCDDTFTESHEDELDACEDGDDSVDESASGAAGMVAVMAPGGPECTSDADCGLCTASEERGCCQCPFVSANASCEAVESSQCAAVDCAIRECPMPGTPACTGGRCVARSADAPPAAPQPVPNTCASDADCVVCEVAVENGAVQCCEPCGMVTTTEQCDVNRTRAGACAAVACPAIACASTPVARCVGGACTAAQ